MNVSIDWDAIYKDWYQRVYRWLRAMGCRAEDLDDVAQDVFFIVVRKRTSFCGDNVGPWLYAIARRRAAAYRRRAWFRHFILGRRDIDMELIAHDQRGTEQSVERREAKELVYAAMAKMTLKRRTVFQLFELEGFSGEEIADLEGVPVKTIWTRLHHARKDFYAAIEALLKVSQR